MNIRRVSLIIAVIAFLPFIFNLQDPFVSDDWDFLHIAATREKSALSYFFTNYSGTHDAGSYRPMVNMFWFAGYGAFGFSQFWYHLATTLFHSLNAVLFFLLILHVPWKSARERKQVAWLATLLFIFLPNHAEAVNWISVINDTLMTTFYLSSFLFFVRSRQYDGKRRIFWYGGSVGLFTLSLLTKEMALSLPVVLAGFLVYEALHSQKTLKRAVWPFLSLFPYGAIVGLWGLARFFATGLLGQSYVGTLTFESFFVWRSYLTISVSHFLSDAARTGVTDWLFHHKVIITLVIFCLLGGVTYAYKKKKDALPAFLLVAYVVSIIPVFQYGVNYTVHYFSEEGERYAYLPSVFVAWLVALALCTLYMRMVIVKKGRAVFAVFMILICVGLGGQLAIKNARWRTASRLADTLVHDFIQKWDEHKTGGVALIGLPDNYHGAFIFRNTFAEAVELSSAGMIDAKDILVTKERTLFEPGQTFSYHSIDQNRREAYLYETSQSGTSAGHALVVGDPIYESVDYGYTLLYPIMEPYSVSYIHYAPAIHINFSKDFIRQNIEKNLKVLFFDGATWNVDPYLLSI